MNSRVRSVLVFCSVCDRKARAEVWVSPSGMASNGTAALSIPPAWKAQVCVPRQKRELPTVRYICPDCRAG